VGLSNSGIILSTDSIDTSDAVFNGQTNGFDQKDADAVAAEIIDAILAAAGAATTASCARDALVSHLSHIKNSAIFI
jgi:hypothetical protein